MPSEFKAGACGLRPHASGASRQAKSRYARLRPKSVSSLSLPMMQGRSLATLPFDPRARVNPHYARLQPKSVSSLSLPVMQGRSLATLPFDPRGGLTILIFNAGANPCYTQLQPKSAYSLSLPMIQGQSLATLAFDPSARPHNAHPYTIWIHTYVFGKMEDF